MKSPISNEDMKLQTRKERLIFRKEEFEIMSHYFLDEVNQAEFTTTELDDLNLTQLYNQYREKYGIPFPDEIREIRERYEVSASKMSEILGFGANTYRLYESGEIPSVANGRLILAVKEPGNFARQVNASSHLLSEKETGQLMERINELIDKNEKHSLDIAWEGRIFSNELPNEYSGYKKPDFRKIANVINFFTAQTPNGGLFKTKLNKLMFYADFGYFKKSGFSITGITYRAIQLGPVPAEYGKLYEKLNDDQLIEIYQVLFDNGNYGDAILGLAGFDDSLFNDRERAILETVSSSFGNLQTNDVVNLSHQESAWIANQEARDLISYQKFAFDLKNIN